MNAVDQDGSGDIDMDELHALLLEEAPRMMMTCYERATTRWRFD